MLAVLAVPVVLEAQAREPQNSAAVLELPARMPRLVAAVEAQLQPPVLGPLPLALQAVAGLALAELVAPLERTEPPEFSLAAVAGAAVIQATVRLAVVVKSPLPTVRRLLWHAQAT